MERDWEIEDAIWLYLLVSVHQNLSKKETALFHRLLPTIKHRVLNRQRECREPNWEILLAEALPNKSGQSRFPVDLNVSTSDRMSLKEANHSGHD